MADFNISIQPIYEVKSGLPFKKERYPIQHAGFKMGLRIKNIGPKRFLGCIIKNLIIRPVDSNLDLKQSFSGDQTCLALSVGSESELWWQEETTTKIEGPIWVECDIESTEAGKTIETYQVDENSGMIDTTGLIGNWRDTSFISGEFQQRQLLTNLLITTLTIITVLQGIFGLRNIALFILKSLGNLFIIIRSGLDYLIQIINTVH